MSECKHEKVTLLDTVANKIEQCQLCNSIFTNGIEGEIENPQKNEKLPENEKPQKTENLQNYEFKVFTATDVRRISVFIQIYAQSTDDNINAEQFSNEMKAFLSGVIAGYLTAKDIELDNDANLELSTDIAKDLKEIVYSLMR